MMPELYLADALGAAGKPIMRVHTAGSVGGSTAVVADAPDRVARARARAHASRSRSSREGDTNFAFSSRPQRWRRRRRLLRAAHPRVHRAVGCARLRRPDGRGEGPPERAEEPVRAPADPRHHASRWCSSRRSCGTPIHRLESCPTSDGACAMVLTDEAGGKARVEAAGVGARHRGAHRARLVPGPRSGEPAGRPGLRGRRLPAGRHHEPARGLRRGRDLRAVQLVRADVDGEPRLRGRVARVGR